MFSPGEQAVPMKKNRQNQLLFWHLLKVLAVFLLMIPQTVFALVKYYFFTELKPLKGKVVLLTGAGNGLGRQLAKDFAKLGCKLACADIDEVGNKNAANELNEMYPECCKAYKANVTKLKDIEELAKLVEADWSQVDILVNNAGLIVSSSLLEDSDQEVEGVIQVNLLSHFRMVRQFLPAMIKRNSGHIVAISSLSSMYSGNNMTAYAASKYGVNGFMNCLSDELNEIPGNRIKVTTVCPYFINTNPAYSSAWQLSLEALSVEDASKEIIKGIRKNEVLFTIPRHMYWIIMTMKLFPERTNDLFKKIFAFKVAPVSKSMKSILPSTDIIADTFHNKSIS